MSEGTNLKDIASSDKVSNVPSFAQLPRKHWPQARIRFHKASEYHSSPVDIAIVIITIVLK